MNKDPAQMFLAGEVGDTITLAGLDRALRDIGPSRPLDVTLRSPGGCGLEANAVYHRLREHAARAAVRITAADVASAGTWLFLAGDERRVAANGRVMLHALRSHMDTPATPTALRHAAASLEGMNRIFAQIVAERTKLELGHVVEILDTEIVVDAARAVELGFAHEVGAEIW